MQSWCALCVSAGVLCIQGSISPGLAGLCLAYALDLTRFLKQGTAMASKSESDFNSVERIVQVGVHVQASGARLVFWVLTSPTSCRSTSHMCMPSRRVTSLPSKAFTRGTYMAQDMRSAFERGL